MFAHLNPQSSVFGDICALSSLFLVLACVPVVVCVACKLRPCLSYSRRRDRINSVLLFGGGGGIRCRPAVRGKRTYGGWLGQHVEEQGTWASRTQKHSEAGYGRPVDRGAWTAKTVKRPRQQPAHPRYANYLTRKRHTMPHSAQPQHTNYWAPRTRKRHQQEHRPQR